MLGEEGTADYMVECGGHRAVLATRSSTIAKGLRSGLVEGILQRWVVKGADPDDVKEMLAFIYTINFVKMHCREVMKSPDWPQSRRISSRPIYVSQTTLLFHVLLVAETGYLRPWVVREDRSGTTSGRLKVVLQWPLRPCTPSPGLAPPACWSRWRTAAATSLRLSTTGSNTATCR